MADDNSPFEWWERHQVGILIEFTREYAPRFANEAERLANNPAEWRRFRAELEEHAKAGRLGAAGDLLPRTDEGTQT